MKMSYFNKFARLPQSEQVKYFPIAISTTVPDWFSQYYEHVHYKVLSPSTNDVFSLKRKELGEKDFAIRYVYMLTKYVDLDSILNTFSIMEFKENKEILLLCYEKSDDFCHRHILADYLKNIKGINVEEL